METVIFYAAELVVGIQFLHSRGIVHRDLKLNNILVNTEGHIKIVDFGMVAEDILGEKKITSPAGVCHFMAPEQHLKKPYGPGVDWWAFGIILCTMATGKSPFYSGTKLDCLVHSVTRTKPCYPEGLSTEAMKLLDEVLEKDPERRLGTRGDIRSHPFFNSIDWADLESLKAPSPWKPEGLSEKDFGDYKEPLLCLEDQKRMFSSRKPVILQEFSYVSSSW
ncbi:hypothetical protein XENTR_v10020520 [Xenopus tropicalis]|nr:hypothetical protein XENTR_v10020520 [Xenopus tropicalis]